MLTNRIYRLLGLSLCLLLLFTATGCQKKQEAKPMPAPQETKGQKAKPPKTAETMLKEIDKILQELDKKARLQRAPQISEEQLTAKKKQAASESEAGAGQSGEKKSDKESGQGKEEASEGESGDKAKQQTKSAPQPSPENDWQAETMSLMKIHQSWNELEPEAIKAGMSSAARQDFETALDKLTQALAQKKLAASLEASIDLYRNFGQVISNFDYPLPQDYFIVRYEVMAVMVAAYSGNWSSAAEHIQASEEPWQRLQTQLDKEQKADADRTGYSIKDLTQAVELKDVSLTYIKGQIVLSNLKKLEEKMSKQQGQG